MKTIAAVLVEQHKPLEIAELEVPTLGYGQVLVAIKSTRICGSQIGEIDGVKGPDKWLPHLLGHEAGGDVLEVGPEVRHVKPGDRVVCHWRPGRGIDARPSVYHWNGRRVNAGPITTFQEFSVISENRLTVVPRETDYEVCALLADTLTTGFGVINNDARVKIGEAVVIIGCGGIGLGVVLGAKLAGAYPVIAVDIHDHKLERALRYGATHTVHSLREDFSEAVLRILEHQKPEVVIDGTANPAVLEKAFALTKHDGRCIVFGVMPHDQKLSINTLPLHFGKFFKGSHGGESQPAEDIPRYLRVLGALGIETRKFFSDRCGLEEVNEAISKMRLGQSIHTAITF
jgi:S-(hydroxymethyl)glutathione dehydrogenase/alcohol dehydrogenase